MIPFILFLSSLPFPLFSSPYQVITNSFEAFFINSRASSFFHLKSSPYFIKLSSPSQLYSMSSPSSFAALNTFQPGRKFQLQNYLSSGSNNGISGPLITQDVGFFSVDDIISTDACYCESYYWADDAPWYLDIYKVVNWYIFHCLFSSKC